MSSPDAPPDLNLVCFSNLIVRHRKRRGEKLFFVTASDDERDVQLSFMRLRGEPHDDRKSSARLTPEAHDLAYNGCSPGAVIAKVWGRLVAKAAVGRTDDELDSADAGHSSPKRTRRCAQCGQPSCVAVASVNKLKCPTAVATQIMVNRIEFTDVIDDDAVARDGAASQIKKARKDCWLVFDMNYDAQMTKGEHGGLSRQITMCVAANKQSQRPFRLAVVGGDLRDDLSCDEAGTTLKKSAMRNPIVDERLDVRGISPARVTEPPGAVAGAPRGTFLADTSNIYTPYLMYDDLNSQEKGPSVWRRLPWRRWGTACFGPKALMNSNFGEQFSKRLGLHARSNTTSDETGNDPEFEPSKVIYLSADADDILESVEPGDVFIIGGVVDHSPKPEVAARRFDQLSKQNTADGIGKQSYTFVTKRLPLDGHISLAKNTHLPCLAVVQMLLVFREVLGEVGVDGKESVADEPTTAENASRRTKWPPKEGGKNASLWGETLARCPAFRCAPLWKYVKWAPPFESLNGTKGKPVGVTDVRALGRP